MGGRLGFSFLSAFLSRCWQNSTEVRCKPPGAKDWNYTTIYSVQNSKNQSVPLYLSLVPPGPSKGACGLNSLNTHICELWNTIFAYTESRWPWLIRSTSKLFKVDLKLKRAYKSRQIAPGSGRKEAVEITWDHLVWGTEQRWKNVVT